MKAKLINSLPHERVEPGTGDGSLPKIGDIVDLDQGFTFPNGQAGGMVVCRAPNGHIRWAGHVLESEIELLS